MRSRGSACIRACKFDRCFDCFRTRVTEVNGIQARRHSFYQFTRQYRGKGWSIKTNPPGKVGIYYLSQCITNSRMPATEIENTPVGQKIEITRTCLIPEISTLSPYPGSIESECTQYLDEDRIYMLFV